MFEPPGVRESVQGSDTCSSLQAPITSDFPGTQMPFLGIRVSLAHVLLEIHPLPSQTTQVACLLSTRFSMGIFLRVSPGIFTAFLRRRAGIVSVPEMPVKAKQLPAYYQASGRNSSPRYPVSFLGSQKRLIICDRLTNSFCKYTR